MPFHKRSYYTHYWHTNNYRPICIPDILSKIMDRFVHTHFSHYLENNTLLTLLLFEFRKLHSTVTSLLHVTDKWLKDVGEGLMIGIVLHRSDKGMWHILMKRLPMFGVTVVWFESYLTGRSQCVCIDCQLSDVLSL